MSEWVRRQRRAFIATTLELRGYINKADLIEQFGVSSPQASISFQDFLAHFPDAMAYDASQKRYVAGPGLRGACDVLASVALTPEVAGLKAALAEARAEITRLQQLMNSPEIEHFLAGVAREAPHQVERWGAEHDTGKSPLDWFWLIGFLAQKAAAAAIAGDLDKARHHCVSTAAAMLNWHRGLSGAATAMRPGIATPPGEVANG